MSRYNNNNIHEPNYREMLNNNIYNVNNNHPLIPNSQEYMFYKKFVSIHSEDRDILKYPSSSEFEIELPEDYQNVAAIRLLQWTFPANYNTFSVFRENILMTFQINNPYNPGEFGVIDEYNSRIFEALWNNLDYTYQFVIEEGFYTPTQMATELTNKFNYAVSNKIREYFKLNGWYETLTQFNSNGGYDRFIVVYNNVTLKLWFGNNADSFILTNEKSVATNAISDSFCVNAFNRQPDSSNYGLPSYLGLSRCNTTSANSLSFNNNNPLNRQSLDVIGNNDIIVPRFFYGDVTPGDNGFWLLPNTDLSGSVVNWIEAQYKINLMGEAFIYMELDGQNCIDETKPYNVSQFTLTTNQTNGVVNAAFAKLPVPTTPLSQWFDRESIPYKYYYPPAERMRKFKVKLRYHNGQPVDFGVFNYSFMLEFTLMVPQILRKNSTVVFPAAIGH